MNEKQLKAVSVQETDQISRNVLGWLNLYPDFPSGIRRIDFEYLDEDKPCMALSTIQGAYKTREYITGDYLAQYQFKIIYRNQPGDSNNNRLKMDEALNSIGGWAIANKDSLILGMNLTVTEITSDTLAGLFGRYENGDEDHQILMTLRYKAKNI